MGERTHDSEDALEASLERVGHLIQLRMAEREYLWNQNAELVNALEGLVEIIEVAGLQNLSNGVQLGPTSWYAKADHRLEQARAALKLAKEPSDG